MSLIAVRYSQNLVGVEFACLDYRHLHNYDGIDHFLLKRGSYNQNEILFDV